MNILIPTKITRYIFAAVMGLFGLFHFIGADDMTGMVPSFVPGGVFWVYLTGAALVAAAVAMIMNKKARLASYLLALMLVLFILMVHVPGMADNPMAMPMILKDLALAVAAIAYGNMLDE